MRAERGVIIQNIPFVIPFCQLFQRKVFQLDFFRAKKVTKRKNGYEKAEEGVEGFGGGTNRTVVRSNRFFTHFFTLKNECPTFYLKVIL